MHNISLEKERKFWRIRHIIQIFIVVVVFITHLTLWLGPSILHNINIKLAEHHCLQLNHTGSNFLYVYERFTQTCYALEIKKEH